MDNDCCLAPIDLFFSPLLLLKDDRNAKPLPPKLKLSPSLPNLFRSRSRASIASFVFYSNEDSSEDPGSPGAAWTEELKAALSKWLRAIKSP